MNKNYLLSFCYLLIFLFVLLTNVKSEEINSNESWYNPIQDYIEITTNKDKIFSLPMDKVLELLPTLNQNNINNLHLLYQGSEYPFYIKDNDSKIDKTDEIIFLGKRGKGDTTWFDYYTDKAVFYLYYDELSNGKQLNLNSILQYQDSIGIMNQSLHKEIELMYSDGYWDYAYQNETVFAEGWFWAVLSPKQKSFFSDYFQFYPTDNNLDSVDISVKCVSLTFQEGASIPPDHRLALLINGDTITTKYFSRFTNDSIKVKIPSSMLLSGINELKISSIGVPVGNTIKSIDQVLVDYYTINGNQKLFSMNDSNCAKIQTINANTKISYSGFTTKEIYAIDTINNNITIPTIQSGIKISVGTKQKQFPRTTILINDSLMCYSLEYGYHIAVLKAPNYIDYEYKIFKNSSELINYITNIPNNSVIALAKNIDEPINNSLIELLNNLGSSIINTIDSYDNYVFSCIKNDKNSVIENNSSDYSANIAKFFNNIDINYYSADIILAAGFSYCYVINDRNQIDTATIKIANKTNLRNTENFADAIIITHQNFKIAADSLAAYRLRVDGIHSIVVDVNDIYKEFYFGKKSAHAIRNFLQYVYDNWTKPIPKYVALMGDACVDLNRILTTTKFNDYIPTYGFPVSDFWFGVVGPKTDESIYAIGRIPVHSLEQALKYVEKLKEYESAPSHPWMKRFLFLSGGITEQERNSFSFAVNYWDKLIVNPYLCADTITIKKYDPVVAAETESNEIRKRINEGATWVNFMGHAAITTFDMDGWQSSRINNKGRYGILSTLSCNSGAFAAADVTCRNEEYVVDYDKGFIASIGSTSAGLISVDVELLQSIFSVIRDTSIRERRIGSILNIGKNRMFSHSEYYTHTRFTHGLLGDPMIKFKITNYTDFYLLKDELKITGNTKQSQITDNDTSAELSAKLYNAGFYFDKLTEVLFIHEYQGKLDTFKTKLYNICKEFDLNCSIPIKNMIGKHKVTIVIDPYNITNDPNRDDNIYELTFEVFTRGLLALEPLNNWNINPKNPVFRVIDYNKYSIDENIKYEFAISKTNDTIISKIYTSVDSEINITETNIDWTPKVLLADSSNYWLFARIIDNTKFTSSTWLQIPFHTLNSIQQEKVFWKQSEYTHFLENNYNNTIIDTGNNNSRIKIKDVSRAFRLQGANALFDSQGKEIQKRNAEIYIEPKVYFDDNYHTGFCMIRVAKDDSTDISIKYYETFNGDPELQKTDTSSLMVNRFLRDSVKTGDYLFMVLSGPAIQMHQVKNKKPDNPGSLDTLKWILKTYYNTSLFDSIIYKSSYVLFAERGNPNFFIEKMDTNGFNLVINDSITYYSHSGSFNTQIIGPATAWDSLAITGSNDLKENKFLWELYGISNKNNYKEQLIKSGFNTDISLKDISASDYPYLKLYCDLNRQDLTDNPDISELSCTFTATPEFALLKSRFNVIPDTVLRADTVEMNFAIKNISKRIAADANLLELKILADNSDYSKEYLNTKKLSVDEEQDFKYIIDSKFLLHTNKALFNINYDNSPLEKYQLNNTNDIMFYLYEDTTKPYLTISADDKVLYDKDYVSIRPVIEVNMYDVSKLEVSNPSSLEIMIDGKLYDEYNSNLYKLEYFKDKYPLKARLIMQPDSFYLKDKNHLIRVLAKDATGNIDTLYRSVYVSQNGFISELINYPNPANDQVSFKFYYKAPSHNAVAKVEVFDVSGKIIAAFTNNITIGSNTFSWNIRDNFNNTLPVGIYGYKLSVISDVFVESLFGTIAIMK